MSEQEHTEAERWRSAEITLVTVREHAERAVQVKPETSVHALGYWRAMRDVLAILDARWLPEGEPVIFDGA
jgi:hypothetical protein